MSAKKTQRIMVLELVLVLTYFVKCDLVNSVLLVYWLKHNITYLALSRRTGGAGGLSTSSDMVSGFVSVLKTLVNELKITFNFTGDWAQLPESQYHINLR